MFGVYFVVWKNTVKFITRSFDRRRSLCRAFCVCNPSLSASHSHHVHPRRSCTSCPFSPLQTSCTSSPSTSAPRASLTKRAGDRQPCGRAPAASGAHTHLHTRIHTRTRLRDVRFSFQWHLKGQATWALMRNQHRSLISLKFPVIPTDTAPFSFSSLLKASFFLKASFYPSLHPSVFSVKMIYSGKPWPAPMCYLGSPSGGSVDQDY